MYISFASQHVPCNVLHNGVICFRAKQIFEKIIHVKIIAAFFPFLWFYGLWYFIGMLMSKKKLSSIFILRLSLSIMISNLQIIFNFVWKYSSWFFKPDLISVFLVYWKTAFMLFYCCIYLCVLQTFSLCHCYLLF